MDVAGNRETLKRRAIVALDEARLELSTEFHRAQRDYSPQALVQKSFEKHRVWWIAGAAAGGLLAVSLVFNKRARAGNGQGMAGSPTVKRTLRGLLFSSLWSLARGPVMEYAKSFVQTQLEGRLAQLVPRKSTDERSNI